MNINSVSEQELFERRLKGQLRRHRERLHLGQKRTADLLCKSYSAYQRWESTGKCLTNIFDILRVFEVLGFSTAEAIDVLGLPPLTADELKDICPDEETMKGIQENGICSYVRMNCGTMDDRQIERLLDILFAERLKRR